MNKTKRKRQTRFPYKKWAKSEEKKLLSYLRESEFFEKPTAQRFYRKFIDKNAIDSDWHLVRSKVRNMRASYQKVKLWLNSTDARTLNEGETIEDVVLKKCPLYYELEEIFGYKEHTVNKAIIDTEVLVEPDQYNADITESEELDYFDELESQYLNEVDDQVSETSAKEDSKQSNECESSGIGPASKSRKGIFLHTALSDILKLQTELISMKKERTATEVKLRSQELELKKEKFLFEKLKRSEEIQLKEKEIEVRILEIEMKERIAMKELELKKEIEMEKLKCTNKV